jgi:hypothetical protein
MKALAALAPVHPHRAGPGSRPQEAAMRGMVRVR